MGYETYRQKLSRIRSGGEIRTLDLFAGCGGLSLGFHASGFSIVGAVEIDEKAIASHALNFFHGSSDDTVALHATPHDITVIEPDELMKELRLGEEASQCVDVIIGGPPCQAFARVGRAKLREIAEHPEAYLKDRRGNLYLRYLDYVRELKPIALMMENVPDVLNYGGHNISEEMCEVLESMGYVVSYSLLNAAFYGVPQMRERMFLIAFHSSIGLRPSFPQPTHWIELPAGYESARQVALKPLTEAPPNSETRFVDCPMPSPTLRPAITSQEAISDLPVITAHLEGKMKRGPRYLDSFTPYPERVEISEYARSMRSWPGFESCGGIYDHVIRYLPRDFPIFRRMNPGDQYPEAYYHALAMFDEVLTELAAEGKAPTPDSVKYQELKRSIVPPYDPGKFPNKWRKMEADKPARTLMAHLGKDGYSHIHYDSRQARTISVREAARLQSFPDGFRFCGAMNAAFRQIGNAVPPLLAKALSEPIYYALKGESLTNEAICG